MTKDGKKESTETTRTKCRYWNECNSYDELLDMCNHSYENEQCIQYISFEEEKGNAPYFALKALKKLRK